MKNAHKQIRFADFRSRLFAMLFDTLIFGVLFIPLVNILKKMLYHGTPPDALLTEIIEKNIDKTATLSELLKTPEILAVLESTSNIQNTIIISGIQVGSFLIMFMIFAVYKQSTPGKMLMLIKIVDEETFEPASKFQYIVRTLSYLISAPPLCLGFFWPIFNKKNQSWHDIIAGTVVIRK